MITIDLTGPESEGKTIEEILDFHSVAISRELINTICEAVDKGASMANVVEIIIPNWKYTMTITISKYALSLQKNIPVMAEVEDYELCAKAIKYIDKINNKINNQKLLA